MDDELAIEVPTKPDALLGVFPRGSAASPLVIDLVHHLEEASTAGSDLLHHLDEPAEQLEDRRRRLGGSAPN